eukprot:720389-Rhodomonas_salina.1
MFKIGLLLLEVAAFDARSRAPRMVTPTLRALGARVGTTGLLAIAVPALPFLAVTARASAVAATAA